MAMDSILATGVGLGLRALIDAVTDNHITAAALVGIWEGVVLNHFLLKHRSSFDPYFAFGFRLFVDFMYTESFERMTMIVLWAFLGMVFADLSGDLSQDHRFRQLLRRLRRMFPFPSRSRARYPSRVRFTSGESASSTTTTRTPQLPLRPTATPFPGAFDQWSIASSETGSPAASLNESMHTDAPRREASRRRPSRLAQPLGDDYTDTNTDIHSEVQRTEPPARSPSELDYLTLPVIPDPEPSPIDARFRDDEPMRSGLTTPTNDPLLRDLHDEDRPINHSGLTTPEHPYINMPTSEGLPPVRITDEYEHTPTRSQLDLPPIPIRPPGSSQVVDETAESRVSFPEPHIPSLLDLTGHQADHGSGLMPPMSEIPNIPTPSFESTQTQNRDTLVDPPPQYEEPMKDVPDHVSVAGSDGGGLESVVSGTTRTEIISKADQLRELAQAKEKARVDYRVALDKARREKRYWDVLWYEGEIEDAELKAKELNAKAAHRYFKAHNLNAEPQTIDVHRLNVVEAVTEVKRALREARGSGSPELRVITGRGKHSKNNIPVLKKALIQKMLEYQIEAKSDSSNPGVLIIAIPQLSLAGVSTSAP